MMRRLDEDELTRAQVLPLTSGLGDPERARASAVVASLHDYMREELALTPSQVEDFALVLERALVLSARAVP